MPHYQNFDNGSQIDLSTNEVFVIFQAMTKDLLCQLSTALPACKLFHLVGSDQHPLHHHHQGSTPNQNHHEQGKMDGRCHICSSLGLDKTRSKLCYDY